jgi:hypothetical protein
MEGSLTASTVSSPSLLTKQGIIGSGLLYCHGELTSYKLGTSKDDDGPQQVLLNAAYGSDDRTTNLAWSQPRI